MKRINAQWVFLIILMLWIPALCFGYEVDGVDYPGPPIPETVEAEHGLMFYIWGWGVIACWVAGGAIAFILSAVGLIQSLRFNYHLYVTHGQFAFWTVDEGGKTWNQRKEVAEKLKFLTRGGKTELADTDLMFLAWWPVSLVCLTVWTAFAISGFLWPIVLFAGLPFFTIRLIAYRKRKKVVFVDKLKDNETNGIV